MPDREMTVEEVLALLAAAPPRLAALTGELAPEQLQSAPAPGEWSANEVLAHLRSCADVWGDGIRAIVAGDHPTLRAVNPRTWIARTDYPDLDFRISLRAYTAQREDLVAFLESLPREAWSRSGTVRGAGKPLERTVFWYAHSLVVHERPHLKQVARIVGAVRPDRHP